MALVLPLVAALVLLIGVPSPRWAEGGDCQVSCQLTLARCIQSGGDTSCFKPWRSCIADKGCEGAYGMVREPKASDTAAGQASPRERQTDRAPAAGEGPPTPQPGKGSRWLPVPAY